MALLALPFVVLAGKAVLDGRYLLAPAHCYADGATPMLANYDGYYFLRLAEALAAGEYGARDALRGKDLPWPPLPLPGVIAGVSALTGVAARGVALGVSCVLALLAVVLAQLWGRRLGGDIAAGVAGLSAALCPYFVDVTSLGKCHTSSLVPTLLMAGGLCLYDWRMSGGKMSRLAAFGGLTALTAWWWRPGGYIMLFMLACVLLAGGKATRLERMLRWITAGGLACAGLVLATGWYERLPDSLAGMFRFAALHIALALKTDAISAAMAGSIIELAPMGLGELGEKALGSAPLLALAMAGLGVAFWRRPWSIPALFPLLLAAGLALRSRRMVVLFFPLAALGLGVLVECALGAVRFKREDTRGVAALVLAVLLMLPALEHALTTRPVFTLDRQTDDLALAVKRTVPAGTVLWSWWDYGYFLQYRAERATFFDGGSQTADDCFVAAFPLTCPDPELAANWMHFFAARGQGEIGRLAARCGSREQAFDLLCRLFSRQEDTGPLMNALGGNGLDDPEGYFFPENIVCLVLPRDFLNISGHWMAYGASPLPPSGPVGNHVDVLASEGLMVDAQAGRLELPRAAREKGYREVAAVVEMGRAVPLDITQVSALAEPILFFGQGLPLTYIVDRAAAVSLGFRLLAPTGFTHARFTPVYYQAGTGGAWLVR